MGFCRIICVILLVGWAPGEDRRVCLFVRLDWLCVCVVAVNWSWSVRACSEIEMTFEERGAAGNVLESFLNVLWLLYHCV